MLTAKEREVVRAALAFCGDKSSCLISESDLLALVNIRKVTARELETIVNSLTLDGYFDVIKCRKDTENMLCITPKPKARVYEREQKQLVRSIGFKLLLTVLGSLVAFLVTKILYGLF